MNKIDFFHTIASGLSKIGFKFIDHDFNRPWGGFFVIEPKQSADFINFFFQDEFKQGLIATDGLLSPKILIVSPEKRLSWQYHNRRSEIWKVVRGRVGVITSDTDQQGNLQVLEEDDIVTLKQGERHRLVGLKEHSIIAEIWQHTDQENPSDEQDIIRVEDDFGR